MKIVDKLGVMYHEKKVGELTMTPDGSRCAFEYSKEWLADGFSISPLKLPLKSDLFIAEPEPFAGNFGVFEDSLPDGYGRYLLNRILKKENIDEQTLSPIQRLSIVGSSGMGALCYVPETCIAEDKSLPDLDVLQDMALKVLGEKSEEGDEILYYNAGNSGGCRPKALRKDADGSWLIKFRHQFDPEDMGLMEYRYNQAARRCGIHVPDFKLEKGKYFATKRFDFENNERLHVITAGALLNESIRQPKLDYKTLLHLTGYLTQDPEAVNEMFRRMVFNVLTSNKDDHAKNFSFIYKDKWVLSPAYDLTLCIAGYGGEHATSVNNNGKPTLEDILIVGESIRITRKQGMAIVRSVYENCQDIITEEWKNNPQLSGMAKH